MTAHALIDQARADGLELQPNGDRLKVRGPADVVERWKPRIVAHKPEIMDALSPIPPDLERLIVWIGTRWEYGPEDYDLIRVAARRDPDGLRMRLNNDNFIEAFEERAAIMEYDGGFSRREAERLAAGEIPPPKR